MCMESTNNSHGGGDNGNRTIRKHDERTGTASVDA